MDLDTYLTQSGIAVPVEQSSRSAGTVAPAMKVPDRLCGVGTVRNRWWLDPIYLASLLAAVAMTTVVLIACLTP